MKSNAFYDGEGWDTRADGAQKAGCGGELWRDSLLYWKNKGMLEDGQTASRVLGGTANLQPSTVENGSFTKMLSKALTFEFFET